MLRKLTIENFFSIKEPQTLDLTIGGKATDPDGRFVETIAGSGKRFPKVVVLFGANASGKTNVLRAIDFVARFLTTSAWWRLEESFPFLPFAAETTKREPTKISIEIDGRTPNQDVRAIYYYELEINYVTRQVLRESLRYNVTGKPRRLFERIGDDITAGSDFILKKNDPVRSKIHGGASTISTLAMFAHPFSKFLYDGLNTIQRNVTPLGKQETTADEATVFYDQSPNALSDFNILVRKFDLGIEAVRLDRSQGQVFPAFRHQGFEETLPIFAESHGTQALYRAYPRLSFGLQIGTWVVIDELDNDIHPLVLPEIIKLFQEPETNPHNAQLIMSCHNATLLEHLVKEEVYFTEKDSEGRTEIYGLQDVRGVRRDDNIYGKYLSGVYGGVPRLG